MREYFLWFKARVWQKEKQGKFHNIFLGYAWELIQYYSSFFSKFCDLKYGFDCDLLTVYEKKNMKKLGFDLL